MTVANVEDGATPQSTADFMLNRIEVNLTQIGDDVGALRCLVDDHPTLAVMVNSRLSVLLSDDGDPERTRPMRRRRRR